MANFYYFDMGNVLVFFDYAVACGNMSNLLGISADEVGKIVFHSPLQQRFESGKVSSEDWCVEVCQQVAQTTGTALPQVTPAELLHGNSAMFTVHEEMLPVIASLKQQEKRLGIFSNTCEPHWDYCYSQFELIEKGFSVHALSHEIGFMKPRPEAYAEAARMAQVAPREIFFTDDREENIVAAVQAGFDAVLFTTVEKLKSDLRDRGVDV
jgi:HAD superfamily hydrolase (TIGR01509 family)